MKYAYMLKFIQNQISVDLNQSIIDDINNELLELKNGDCAEVEIDGLTFLIDKNLKNKSDNNLLTAGYIISRVE
ncbi:hypothetical protein [Clostridium sp. 1001283B150210_160208_E6]|uniref:hypothetical protein n=1 Tax=Clostridium sp. 1001283B150210_160208_E6 TaxID=2787129 RepID=UPI0018AC1093|nr:hypothetical protein [Clostridium sp. 1001283B150210_160208_E6]